MSATQQSLNFGAPRSQRARSLARRTDPASSEAAAQKMIDSGAIESQAKRVWKAMLKNPGHTSKQLALLSHLDRHMFGRRCSGLQRKGHAVEIRRGNRELKYYAIIG